jgi:hypothetical protein
VYNSGLIPEGAPEDHKDIQKDGDLMLKTFVLRIKHRFLAPLVAPGVLLMLIALCFAPLTTSCIVKPVIHLVKTGPTYGKAGDAVTFTYLVNNSGSVPISNVTVIDDRCGPVVYSTGDTGDDGILEKPETWVYSCTYVPLFNVSQPLTNTATVMGAWEDRLPSTQLRSPCIRASFGNRCCSTRAK